MLAIFPESMTTGWLTFRCRHPATRIRSNASSMTIFLYLHHGTGILWDSFLSPSSPPSAPLLPSTHPLIPVGRCLRFSGDVRFFRILSVLRPSSIILPILIGSPIESGESESPCRDSRGSSADRFHIPLINSD